MQTIDTPPPITHQPLPPRRPRSSTSRMATIVLGATMLVGATGLLGAAGLVHVADDHWRQGDYLTSDTMALDTSAYAMAAEKIDLGGQSDSWALGTARVRVTDDDSPVFIGVARTDDAADFLAGVEHVTLDEIDEPANRYVEHAGAAPTRLPTESDIWVEQSQGTGTQTVVWPDEEGSWTVVVMNADGAGSVHVDADVQATAPIVHRVVVGLVVTGALSAAAGFALLLLGRRRPRALG